LRSERDRVILSYRHRRFDEPWKEQEYPVMLEWTPCNYGGMRIWFRCPIWSCGRRVAVLYGNGMFACRQCHQLAYESQREQPYNRAFSRAQAIVETLGGTWADGFPDKPKGMHWRTILAIVPRIRRLSLSTKQQIMPKSAMIGFRFGRDGTRHAEALVAISIGWKFPTW